MIDRFQNLINAIRIINTDSIGNVTFFKMLADFGDTEKILYALPKILAEKNIEIPSEDFAKQEIETAQRNDTKIILWSDSDYPETLKNIYGKPVLLYAKGNRKLLQSNCVAIVGTRNPSIASKNFATEIARNISDKGFVVVSGMALGIDASAHAGAITQTRADTIAVLGGGVCDIYPNANRKLYAEIIEKGGLILSERRMDCVAKASDFPKRNRIISGLSCALILTEAAEKSGSLITARYAMEQGKLIYAVPSHPSDARAYGPNKLIANGARIFSSPQDFMTDLKKIFTENKGGIYNPIPYSRNIINSIKDIGEEFENSPPNTRQENNKSDDDLEKHIMNLLSSNPIDIETIFQELKNDFSVTIPKFSEIILQMELSGKISNSSGQLTKILH